MTLKLEIVGSGAHLSRTTLMPSGPRNGIADAAGTRKARLEVRKRFTG